MDDPIANSTEAQEFRKAVHEDDMMSAYIAFEYNNSSDGLKKYYGEYLISLEGSKLVELINNGTNDSVKAWMLQVLLVYANQSLIDEVFEETKPSKDILEGVAWSGHLVCMPQRFTYFLGKIDDKQGQKEAIKIGVYVLFNNNKTECFDPLLSALKEGTFMNTDLENIAILKAVREASAHQDDRILPAKRFFDHPVISSEDYSNALYVSYNWGGQAKELFYWLLPRADRQDLEAVKRVRSFSNWPLEFQQAVNQVFQTVGIDARPGITHRRKVAIMEEALDDYIPKDLRNIINGYHLEW